MSLMESLRVRVGLSNNDTGRDEQITLAKDTAFAFMGSYCDRLFPSMIDQVERFTHVTAKTLLLKRYPIDSVGTIVDEDGREFTAYHIEANTGLIHFDSGWAFHQVDVTYTGGYDVDALPSDLLMAFYSVFDQEYHLICGCTDTSSQKISSVTVADVGTIRYNNDAPESAYGEGAYLPIKARSLLEPYKRYKC